ncbi:MAG: CpsD/CapB family tyrosine-protein kinase [Candidatus Acidiferrales bacterium]
MSRNFDILQRADGRPGGFPPHGGANAPNVRDIPASPHRSHARRDAAGDEVAKLVQRLFILPEGGKALQAVAFCGVGEGDGCSWVCAHAGEYLAEQATGTVCIVDANLRSPSLHKYFHLDQTPGFTESARDARPMHEFARRASGTHLWLIPAGATGGEPNGALNPARLRGHMADLRSEFDHILIDTPALSAYHDAILLGQAADGVVLVVGSHSTRREPARIAKEGLEAANLPVLGAVLNRRTFPIPEKLYRKL